MSLGGSVTSSALCCFRKQLRELEEAGMLRGQLTAAEQLALLSSHEDLAEALEGAFFVQVTLFHSHRRSPLHRNTSFCLSNTRATLEISAPSFG